MDSNIITSIGVTLILVAYYLEVSGKLNKNAIYFWLNVIGSILAGIGAYLVSLWPIVFLEVVWTVISLYELYELSKKEKTP
jgi:putative flippase GtrA